MLTMKFQNVTASACLIVFGEKTVIVNIPQHLITPLCIKRAESTQVPSLEMEIGLDVLLVTSLYLFCIV